MIASPDSSEKCFVDSNIWLYAIIESPESAAKSVSAKAIVTERQVVSTQVVNEVCVNLLRKAQRSEDEIRRVVRAFYAQHHVMPIDELTMLAACKLREAYSLSYWDSLIVATAIEGGATVLYSEDMQHGLRIDANLRIVNPFVGSVER